MSNNNPPLIILAGVIFLSLILVTGSPYAVYAQEEEEEEEDKDKEDDEKESKDKEEDEEDKEESKDKEEDEESKEDDETSNNNDSIQIIQDQLTPPPLTPQNDTVITTVTPQVEEEPITATPTTTTNKEFNATCKCMTTTSPLKPTTPEPQQPNNNNNNNPNKPIPISNINIEDFRSFGEVTDPAYTDFYTVPNLLDNTIDDVSFWSQAGPTSGFYIQLDNALDNYQVCSAELNVHNPKNTPYLLDIGVSKNYTGMIDQTNEQIQFDKCVKNMDEIYMTFDNEAGSFVSIAELKLFGSELGAAADPITSPQEPATPIPPTENATNKINIQDSTAEIDIKNSTVTFKFDPLTATFVGSK